MRALTVVGAFGSHHIIRTHTIRHETLRPVTVTSQSSMYCKAGNSNSNSLSGSLSDIFDSTWCFLAVGFAIVSVFQI